MMLRIDAPIVANQVLASASAIFSWAIKQEILTVNPCKLVDRNPTKDRERVLSDEEVRLLWPKLDPALKLMLLTGQRPGEVAAMRAEHIIEGWWQMPGKPKGDWLGTKNARDHRVALSEPVQALIDQHLAGDGKRSKDVMRDLVAELKIERATPHDLRRTCLTWITRLGFGRDAMDRVANHRTASVTDVYDRHGYADGGQADHVRRGAARSRRRRGGGNEQRGQPEMRHSHVRGSFCGIIFSPPSVTRHPLPGSVFRDRAKAVADGPDPWRPPAPT